MSNFSNSVVSKIKMAYILMCKGEHTLTLYQALAALHDPFMP